MNKKAIINIETEVGGFWKIEAQKLNPDGTVKSKRLCADWFPNLITNLGMDQLGTTGVSLMDSCQVGSGSTAPAFTDVQLAAFVAGVSNSGNQGTTSKAASAPYCDIQTTGWTFAIGAATGNLTEIGAGPSPTASTLFSRALILDGGGSPTVITILSDEQLVVTYVLKQYFMTADVSGTFTISGSSYDIVIRTAMATTVGYGGPACLPAMAVAMAGGYWYKTYTTNVLGGVTSQPSGSNLTSDGQTWANAAYVDGTHYRDATMNAPANLGSSDIGSILFANARGCYQASFTPPLPKTNTKALALTFRFSWARH